MIENPGLSDPHALPTIWQDPLQVREGGNEKGLLLREVGSDLCPASSNQDSSKGGERPGPWKDQPHVRDKVSETESSVVK